MSSYRNRPKGNYIHDANWQDLYILAERWKNDIEFQFIEVEFLERLVETYFVKLLINMNLDELHELQRDIFEAKKQCKNILRDIQAHLDFIVDIMDDPYKSSAKVFRIEYGLFEDNISEFTVILKAIKYVVFKITKDVLDSEKPKFIWKYN